MNWLHVLEYTAAVAFGLYAFWAMVVVALLAADVVTRRDDE